MKRKHVYRIHFTLGYRSIIFSKSLPEKPYYGMMIIDSNNNGDEVNIILDKETSTIYYNVLLDRTEVEVKINITQSSIEAIEYITDIVSVYQALGWRCETIKQDIEDLISFIENRK